MSDQRYNGPSALNAEEIHCLSLLAHGKDVGTIADLRGADGGDIERLLNAAEAKLGARNRLQTVLLAAKLGLIAED